MKSPAFFSADKNAGLFSTIWGYSGILWISNFNKFSFRFRFDNRLSDPITYYEFHT